MRDGRHQLSIVFGTDLDFIGDDAVTDMGDTALELVACAALHEGFLKIPAGRKPYLFL